MKSRLKTLILFALFLCILFTSVSCKNVEATFSDGYNTFQLYKDGTGKFINESGKKFDLAWNEREVTTNKVNVYNIYKDQFGYMNNVLFTSKEDVLSSDKMILEVERNKFSWLYRE